MKYTEDEASIFSTIMLRQCNGLIWCKTEYLIKLHQSLFHLLQCKLYTDSKGLSPWDLPICFSLVTNMTSNDLCTPSVNMIESFTLTHAHVPTSLTTSTFCLMMISLLNTQNQIISNGLTNQDMTIGTLSQYCISNPG